MANIFSTILADIEAEWSKLFGSAGASISVAVEADIKIIGSGLTGALAAFEAVTGLNPSLVANVQSIIASIETAALSITSAIATNIAKPIVVQIGSDFAALEAALVPVSLPAALTNILKAVTTLLPYIEAGVGILTAATVGAAEATGFSHDEAVNILSGVTQPAVGAVLPTPVADPGFVTGPVVVDAPVPGVIDPAVAPGIVNDDGSVSNADGSTTFANPGSPE
jgi:hypothetical protein